MEKKMETTIIMGYIDGLGFRVQGAELGTAA